MRDISVLAADLKEGDRLRLVRQPDNRYDPWSIRVCDKAGRRLGYLAADVNEVCARLMDGGKALFAEVVSVERKGEWTRIGIGVWLDD